MLRQNRITTRVFLFAVFLGFLVLYAFTAQRDVNWQDSGVRQWRILTGNYAGAEGIALSHPLYIGLAHVFAQICPLGSPLLRLNLFSALGMALALTFLALLVSRLTKSLRAAGGAVLLLGLAHMPWWLATITEVYTWSLAAFLLELVLLQSLLAAPRIRTLVALALVGGIGLSMHDFALLSLTVWVIVAVLLVRRGQLPWWALGWGLLAYAIGSAPFLMLVAQTALSQHSLGAAISSALFGASYARQVLGMRSETMRYAVPNLCLILLNFASPCWLLAGAGVWVARSRVPRTFRVCLVVLTTIHATFFLRYFVADQSQFALPTLALLAVWAGIGLAWLLDHGNSHYDASNTSGGDGEPPSSQKTTVIDVSGGRRVVGAGFRYIVYAVLLLGLLIAPVVYWGVWQLVVAGDLMPHRARVLPFRSEARYWLLPWKCNEHSAQQFADAVWAQLTPDAVLYADGSAAGPLFATAAASQRTIDAQIISSFNDSDASAVSNLTQVVLARPFYVVSPVVGYAPDSLLKGAFAFTKTGVLYRVTCVTPRSLP